MYRKGKGLISLELNGLDSRFNRTRFLNMDDARKVLLHNYIKDIIQASQTVQSSLVPILGSSTRN